MKAVPMTRFLDATDVAMLVRRIGLGTALQQLASCVRQDFLRWPRFEKAARVASHSPVGVIELMPVTDGAQYAFKYVNGHPHNAMAAMPTVMAFGVLAEVCTGFPLLLADLTLLTALRTAATSALAARAMAVPGADTMALIGNGAQAEFQVLAFLQMLGVRHVRAFDVDGGATARLRRNLAHVPGLTVTAATSIDDALQGAQLITTATADKTRATVLRDGQIGAGVHINALGGDCPGKTELDAALLRRARVVVEYEPQTRIEGEIQQLPPAFPVIELWRILAQEQPGRLDAADVTVFDSVGFALEDYAALRWLHAAACEHHAGRHVELVAIPEAPADLYGWMLQAEQGEAEGGQAQGLLAAGKAGLGMAVA
ncbi:ornithine cyclodeaminase [Cupriavidus sp. AU9028]|uniref:ornithine cyclodeaminase n=1 Tax=Cupriavidus sp. AU9028 TaxID=2871157 RepID=UPI001C9427F2|nr:ornithine cyclodeaminase [Cupriavidus sp. AU9028]MBY4895514.1 ornithine cyclodeaminase [Cupriavidus sp. AU9028]